LPCPRARKRLKKLPRPLKKLPRLLKKLLRPLKKLPRLLKKLLRPLKKPLRLLKKLLRLLSKRKATAFPLGAERRARWYLPARPFLFGPVPTVPHDPRQARLAKNP